MWLLNQSQTYFCLRLRRNEYIEIEPGIWLQLQHLGIKPGCSIYLKGVKVTKSQGFKQGNIASKWKRKSRGWSVEEAWFILTNLPTLSDALTGYQRRFGIEEMFRDFKSGGYNLEGTAVRGQRLIGLILIITLAYSSATMSGEKIKRQGVVKYVGRVQEHSRKQRRHSSFYLGLHGLSWVESLQFFEGETRQLSRLTPHKERYYRRGRQAARLIRHTL